MAVDVVQAVWSQLGLHRGACALICVHADELRALQPRYEFDRQVVGGVVARAHHQNARRRLGVQHLQHQLRQGARLSSS